MTTTRHGAVVTTTMVENIQIGISTVRETSTTVHGSRVAVAAKKHVTGVQRRVVIKSNMQRGLGVIPVRVPDIFRAYL